jgi:spore germination protein GerM
MMARRALFVAVVALLLAACGISTDDAPRAIPVGQQRQLGVNTDRNVGAATGTARVYLLTPEIAGRAQGLVAVARDVDETPIALLGALFEGPNSSELSRQLRTALPTGIELLDARLQGGVLRVDVSDEMLQLSGQVLVAAVAQIVFTGSDVAGARSVKILVDGADQQWPAGNGDLQSAPLTVYDFPGLVQSSQPDYPAIPSPPT